jgi:hypothetical protein
MNGIMVSKIMGVHARYRHIIILSSLLIVVISKSGKYLKIPARRYVITYT